MAQDMGMRPYAEVSDGFDAGLDRAIEVGAGGTIEHRTDETRDEIAWPPPGRAIIGVASGGPRLAIENVRSGNGKASPEENLAALGRGWGQSSRVTLARRSGPKVINAETLT